MKSKDSEKIATGIKYCPLCNAYYNIIVTWESFWEYDCKCKNCNSKWIIKRRRYTNDWYLILTKSDDNGIGLQYVNDNKTFSFWKNFSNLSYDDKKKNKKKLKSLKQEERDSLTKLYKKSCFDSHNNFEKNLREIDEKILKLKSNNYNTEELDWMLD